MDCLSVNNVNLDIKGRNYVQNVQSLLVVKLIQNLVINKKHKITTQWQSKGDISLIYISAISNKLTTIYHYN